MLPIAALDAGPRVARALGCGPIEGRDGIARAKLDETRKRVPRGAQKNGPRQGDADGEQGTGSG